MAFATFTTDAGTEIRISNIASSASLEIVKTIVPIIEAVEEAEINGGPEAAAGLIDLGVRAPIGNAEIILTGRPEEILFIDTDLHQDVAEFVKELLIDELFDGEEDDDEEGQPNGELQAEGAGDEPELVGVAVLDEDGNVQEPLDVADAMFDHLYQQVSQLNAKESNEKFTDTVNALECYGELLGIAGDPQAGTILALSAGLKLGREWQVAIFSDSLEELAEVVAPLQAVN